MWTNCRLLLFTRFPEAGKTKTRLIPALGADGAAMLQKRLTEKVLSEAELLKKRLNIPTVVHYAGSGEEKMSTWLAPLPFVKQVEGDLGQRMQGAFEHSFEDGAQKAILIGSDIPDINFKLLEEAFTALQGGKIVIGPSLDGGYYLIGFSAEHAPQLLPLLFQNMRWSTPDLFTTTLSRIEKSGLKVVTLPTLRDIDLPEDLPFARDKGLL